MSEKPPVALVVGATSGIGFSVAVRLFEEGYRVYGAGRTAATRAPVGVIPCPLDVRSDDEVRRGVGAILDAEGRIDVLIGGPARVHLGAIEETSFDDDEAVWDVTYRGAMRVVRAALPSMRRRRAGRIVHVCSLLTDCAQPFISSYAAANAALLRASECLRHEASPFGIAVSAVVATDRKTALFASTTHAEQRIADYAEARAALERAIAHAGEPAAPPGDVADLVLAILERRAPAHVYRTGAFARWLPWLLALFPYRMNERGLRRHMYLPPAVAAGRRARFTATRRRST
jgi:NAD(P)-dependent dehydrogenase (short-subunit alcohol dehydrogenase family)